MVENFEAIKELTSEDLAFAKKMLNKKIDLTTISEITGLSIKELKNL